MNVPIQNIFMKFPTNVLKLYFIGVKSYSRWMKCLALQFPGGMKVLLRNLCLKLRRLGLCNFHAVQWADDLDVTFCKVC